MSAAMLHGLPDGVDAAHGALAEPLAVGLRAVALTESVEATPICVLGAGPIGVMTTVALRARGHGRVVAVEVSRGRRERMADLGIPTVTPDDASSRVAEALSGERPAAVIDCTGHPSGAPLGLSLLQPGGRLVVVGLPARPAAIDLATVAIKELTIRGSMAYSREEFAEAIAHIAAGRVPYDGIVTAVGSLDEAQQWFAELSSSSTNELKVLLHP